MALSSFSLIFAAVLISECCTSSDAMAMPKGTLDKVQAERALVSSFLTTEALIDNSIDAITSNQHSILENSLADGGRMKVVVITDMGHQDNPQDGALGPIFSRAPASHKLQDTDGTVSEKIQNEGRRDTSKHIPVERRDFDVLRCMVGRVYRPCWQV
ncbi:pro-MCH [Arapaima gigas]